ncbi:MAG: DEAD/DEAH box helicase, partial [Candidatus Thalassarchaeaceae archaeon]|nr:DEAD/DEAH box helicase [Candidatus Thalassarchaeaceae archaeon]
MVIEMNMVIAWTAPTEATGMEEVIVNEPIYATEFADKEALLNSLCSPVRNWFDSKFPDFTDPQKLAIPVLQSGGHLLLCSPTGSGKTLTAFLSIIDDLVRLAMDGNLKKSVHCVYISPIKALANDIQRNLIEPLREIKEGYLPSSAQDIVVGLRTGDTSQSDRQKMLKNPPHILITTPESLALAIGSSRFRPILQDLRYLIIDEMHSLVPTKRGTHLALALAQLDNSISKPVQRIGISATMEPLKTVAEFLVSSSTSSDSPVTIAHISGSRSLDLDILLPTDRFNHTAMKDILDRNVEVIKELVNAHNTTLVFANTRRMTEVLVQKLRALHVEGVEGHHGSMDKKIRLDVEQRLKRGELRAVVSSSSLEMGIDIGSVDMVVQV